MRKKTSQNKIIISAAGITLSVFAAAVLIFYFGFRGGQSKEFEVNSDSVLVISSGVSEIAEKVRLEKEEAAKKAAEEAAKKAAEEEAAKKAAEEAAKKAEEERKAEAEKSSEKKKIYEEYLYCMQKAEELEKTLSSDVSAWNMILCNPTHALPDGYFDNLELTSIYGGYKVDSRIYYNVKAMFLAAKLDGITLSMISAYRDIDLQTRNFNNKMNYYINQGWDKDKAYAKTATIIAVPGTSEHHTGLALDILTPSYTSLTADFDKTAAYKWLEEHCTEFGFILRYAKDKTDVTKIIYEPWHYRFVGIENAKKITASGLSYEEYLGITD